MAKVSRSKQVAVLRFLEGRSSLGASVKEVQKKLHLSQRAVYRALQVLVREQRVGKFGWGLYRTLTEPQAPLARTKGRIGVHGIVFTGQNWPPQPPGRDGHSATDEVLPLGSFGEWKRRPEGFWTVVTEFHRRTVRFVWWADARRLMVYLSTSKNPLLFSELREIRGWLEAKCGPVDPGDHLEWVESSPSIDYKQWSIQWGKAVKYAAWDNAHIQLYEKLMEEERVLRAEVEWHKDPHHHLPFEKGMEIITALDPDVQMARALQRQAEAELAKAKAEEARVAWEREKAQAATKPDDKAGFG